MLSPLLQLSRDYRFDLTAYCFMPDHAHALLEATDVHSDLRPLMRAWKQQTGYEHGRLTGARLWQHGYYDHVLRRDEDRIDVVAYIVANPLRAGLVHDIEAYPFWGSSVWSRAELLVAIQGRTGRWGGHRGG